MSSLQGVPSFSCDNATAPAANPAKTVIALIGSCRTLLLRCIPRECTGHVECVCLPGVETSKLGEDQKPGIHGITKCEKPKNRILSDSPI